MFLLSCATFNFFFLQILIFMIRYNSYASLSLHSDWLQSANSFAQNKFSELATTKVNEVVFCVTLVSSR